MTVRKALLGASAAAFAMMAVATPSIAMAQTADQRVAALEKEVETLRRTAAAAHDRARVENLFSRYMYLHNAFRDTDIIPRWAKKGTPDVRAQYSNLGVYTDRDKVMSYHQGRTDLPQRLEVRPPEPYRTFSETFAY